MSDCNDDEEHVGKCENCDEPDAVLFICDACGYGEGKCHPGVGRLCIDCVSYKKCDSCSEYGCVMCCKKTYPCCGMILCGAEKSDEKVKAATRRAYREACVRKHVVETGVCGHPVCNLNTKGTCLTCHVQESNNRDTVLVEELLSRTTSESLEHVLRDWIDRPQKRTRDENTIEELEAEVKARKNKMSKCWDDCTCGARWFLS